MEKKIKVDLEQINASLKANKYLLNRFPNLKDSIEKENEVLLKRLNG